MPIHFIHVKGKGPTRFQLVDQPWPGRGPSGNMRKIIGLAAPITGPHMAGGPRYAFDLVAAARLSRGFAFSNPLHHPPVGGADSFRSPPDALGVGSECERLGAMPRALRPRAAISALCLGASSASMSIAIRGYRRASLTEPAVRRPTEVKPATITAPGVRKDWPAQSAQPHGARASALYGDPARTRPQTIAPSRCTTRPTKKERGGGGRGFWGCAGGRGLWNSGPGFSLGGGGWLGNAGPGEAADKRHAGPTSGRELKRYSARTI